MFEYIRLKNFKSFEDIFIDFRDKKNGAKPLIILLGPNGIGKSNIVSVFELLSDLFATMDVRDFLQELISRKDFNPQSKKNFMDYLHENFKDIEYIISDNKMIGSSENMYVELGFSIKSKLGVYTIETNNTQIIHEHLEYTLIKNRGTYFDITPDSININRKLFASKESYAKLQETAREYWGKHSIFSILMHEISDKSNAYMEDQLSDNLKEVILHLYNVSCANLGYKRFLNSNVNSNLLRNLKHGEIKESEKNILVQTENKLNLFFTTMFPNINAVHYKTETNGATIKYELYFQKHIGSKLRDIRYSLESDGITALVTLFPLLINAVDGYTSVIDEFDNGLHKILSKSIIDSIQASIKGQLILTTHNTNLLDSKLPSGSIYIILEDKAYNKYVKCLTDCNQQINVNSNREKQYLEGKYQGIPQLASIDFNKLI